MAESRSTEIIVNGKKANASVKELEASVSVLYKQWKKMERGTDEYQKKTAELKDAKKRLGDVRSELRDTDKATTSLRENFAEFIPFGGRLQQVSNGMNKVATSAKLVRTAMLAIPILAIIAAITTLLKFFFDTQEGMDKLTAVTRPLIAIWERLKGLLQELGGKLFNELAEAIKNPKQAFMDLVDFMKTTVVNQFKAFGVIAEGLSKLLKGDFNDGIKTLTDGTIQLATGVENATDKINGAIKSTGDFVKESIEIGTQLDQLQKNIERTEINLIQNRAALNAEYNKAKEIAQDQLRSEEERIAAAKRAQAAQNELLNMEQEFLDLKIEKMQIEHSLNDTSREDEKELAMLIAERTDFEATAAKKRASARSLEVTAIKEEAAERKKSLDAQTKAYEEYQRTVQNAELELQRLKIEVMEEGIEKELALLEMEHEQRVAKIEEQRQEIIDNALLTEEQKAEALALFEEQQKELEAEKAEEEEELRLEQREEDLERMITDLEEEDALKQAKLEEQFLNTMSSEYEREQALLDLQKQFLQKKLKALEDAGKGETAEAIRIANEIKKIDKEKADNSIAEEQRINDAKIALQQAGYDAARGITESVIELSGEETKAKRVAVAALKAIKIAEVVQSGIREVSGYWEAYSSIPVAGPIIAAGLTAAAVARRAIAVNNIRKQKFDKGGYTGPGVFVDGHGYLRDNTGYRIAGVVHENEWVAPAWQVQDPKYANVIGYLEAARQTRGYADGGAAIAQRINSTAPNTSPSAGTPPIPNLQNDAMQVTNQKLDIMIQLLTSIMEELPVAVPVLEVEEKLNQLNNIRSKSRIQ